MKKVFLTLAIAGFGFIANAQPPAGDAKTGESVYVSCLTRRKNGGDRWRSKN